MYHTKKINMKNTILLSLVLILSCNISKSTDCNNGRYKNPIFTQVKRTNNIVYATKPQSDGSMINLRYDVYEPQGDTASKRAVMLLIHGGAYLKLLDQNSPDIVLMCEYYAKRGYVAISIDYRQEPNVLGLLSEEVMVKSVARALIDTKDAVDHVVNTVSNGNPYRIDTSKAFIGGVSAGAVSSMFICYLDSIKQLPIQYQQWVVQAAGSNADSVLRHKFDHIKPKAAIIISGAILDTSWVVNNGIQLLLDHGSADPIVPYNYGKPFSIPSLPNLYGGKAIYARALNQGIYVEFEDWIGKGHVPFFNLDFGSIITLNLINQPILDSTERHIRDFCYRLLDCNSINTGIKENFSSTPLTLFPNPSKGSFTIKTPPDINTSKWKVEIYNIEGSEVLNEDYSGNTTFIHFNQQLSPGLYIVKMQYEKEGVAMVYTGKLTIAE